MVKIESSFGDYYDLYADSSSGITYHRERLKWPGRASELAFLVKHNIETVRYGTFRKFRHSNIERFVVYTDPLKHNGEGKHVYRIADVENQYSNRLVAEFIENNGQTLKIVQIGSRRFMVRLFHDVPDRLEEGQVQRIDEIEGTFTTAIGLPIYSIDYVFNEGKPVAVDFNEVQHLGKLGFEKVMSGPEVIDEIHKSIIAYGLSQ